MSIRRTYPRSPSPMMGAALTRRAAAPSSASNSGGNDTYHHHQYPVVVVARRYQSTSTRDQRRNQPNAELNSGNQTQLCEGPDLTHHLRFGSNTLEHVSVPEVDERRRNRSDLEKDRDMRAKFGELGPGERPSKNAAGTRRDMLQEVQDIDGLPWEVRWRKNLIPTAEEVLQDIRDRFDLYIQDPVDRDVEWYLHWKDRSFRMQPDRLIWPQGFTDYLDHYDAYGRRRVLPTDQRWSDTSWKYLADAKYRDRMWMIEGEERKAVHLQLASTEQLIADEERRQSDVGDVVAGLTAGVIDVDQDQAYQALSGTADPMEVAKSKAKINAYGAHQALQFGRDVPESEIDPISGFPKAHMEPLASGLTVEQGAAIAMQANIQQEMVEQASTTVMMQGKDPVYGILKSQHYLAKKAGDKPGISTLVEGRMDRYKELQEQQDKLGDGAPAQSRGGEALGSVVAALEGGVDQTDGGSTKDASGTSSAVPRPSSSVAEEGADNGRMRSDGATGTTTTSDGFIPIPSRPSRAEPTVANDLYNSPRTRDLDQVPEWYRQQVIETQPLIQVYGLTQDPLETRGVDGDGTSKSYYTKPEATSSVLGDDANQGANSFDDLKIHKLKTMPELTREFKPLPIYKEAIKGVNGDSAATAASLPLGPDGKPLKRSERLRRERLERQEKAKLQYDPDVMLPTLPWETDSIPDPYRGVATTDAIADVEVDKKALESTWMAYRNFYRQTLTEFNNLTSSTDEEQCVKMLLDRIKRIQADEVSEHAEVPKDQLAVIQLVFEAHIKQFLSDFFRFRNVRATESQVYKTEADELLRKASAKSKLLGKRFVDFVQEMTSLELDSVRQNPVQKYTVLIRDKKLEPIAKPFGRWVESQLSEFIITDFSSAEQLETNREFLLKSLKEARYKSPSRIDGVKDSQRDAAVEALHHWCSGNLAYYAGKHYYRMFMTLGETRFRSKAEDLSETANESFVIGYKSSKDILSLPVPETDPPHEYDEKEFLDGEHAVYAELMGNFEKAESIWHSGSTKRWYPMLDETEYMWFCERRGRYSTAVDISDRCLENLNKRTHPSIHQFPDRARPFLEGAPLTQETAEHLWLRYMGDVYMEHSRFMQRMGRFATARNYREKSLNLHHLAVRTAQERLPASWRAPLFTQAKYMMNAIQPSDDPGALVQQVDTVVDQLYALSPQPRNWVEPESDLPIRIALISRAVPLYSELVVKEAAKTAAQPTPQELMALLATRAKGGTYTHNAWFAATDAAAERIFRQRILKWRAKEIEGSDPYFFLTHLYFSIRVQPKSPEDVQKYWDMYEPVFLNIYTRAALSSRTRGIFMINDALRRICQILLPGTTEHHTTLMKELVSIRDKLSHIVNRKEMDRTINALEAHMVDPRKQTYVYGTALVHQDAIEQEKMRNNQVLKIDLAAKDYNDILERTADVKARSGTGSMTTHEMAQQQGKQSSKMDSEQHSFDEGPGGINTREAFLNEHTEA